MGQKITEHPSVDTWVKLMRERDRFSYDAVPNSAKYHRPATDKREWEQYQDIQRARTKIVHSVPDANTDASLLDSSNYCLTCGTLLSVELRATKRPKRSVWLREKLEPIHFFTCGDCA